VSESVADLAAAVVKYWEDPEPDGIKNAVQLGVAIAKLKHALAQDHENERVLQLAFARAAARLPGRYEQLRDYLRLAPREAAMEFLRLIENYEQAIHSEARRAQLHPWRRV
jgi:predicted trehalose synthase